MVFIGIRLFANVTLGETHLRADSQIKTRRLVFPPCSGGLLPLLLLVYVCLRTTRADCPLWPLLQPPQLDRPSQHLPLKGEHDVDHLQAAGDFFQDAVLLPQLVQLPVALGAEVQWVAPSTSGNKKAGFIRAVNQVSTRKRSLRRVVPKVRIGLPVFVQVRSWVRAPPSFTSHQHDLALSYSVGLNQTSFIKHLHLTKTLNKKKAHRPEEHAHPSTAGGSVGSASSHILSIQLAETARALRAQHGPTEQAQRRVLPLVVCRLGTPEDEERSRLQQTIGEESE